MHQPPFDIAADLDTPVSAFLKLRAFEPSFLLESVEGGTRLARYSFIGLGKGSTLRVDDLGLWVDSQNVTRVPTLTDIFAAIRQTLTQAPRLEPAIPGVPLDGGLVGSIGYDFIRRIEKLGRKPQQADGMSSAEVLLVAPRSLLIFDHLTRRVAFTHAGPEWERLSLRREIIHALRLGIPSPSPRAGHSPPRASLTQAEFLARVAQVKEHIAAGDIFQLVLSIRFSGTCRTDPFEVYRALRLLNPSPYLYYVDVEGTQLVGSSPEALVKLSQGSASLRPIAGTRPRGQNEDADKQHEASLLADPKEAAEHVMLVDLARNDLGRVAHAGSVHVAPFRSIERYSHVMHIVSGVQGSLAAGKDALDLLAATFPAGTLVGAPKVRAMQIIDQLEPEPRGFYGGTVGYFSKPHEQNPAGNMDQAIAIRTIAFHNGAYAYQAGAGIVADSDPLAEFNEIRAKVGVLEAAILLAEEGI
jgi:anthranilate synthase component I